MKYIPDVHNRRSIRLKGYDYSQAGLYFITICTQNRLCLFGEIKNEEMILNEAGAMIEMVWCEMPKYYNGINLDAFQIMPNHIHGIIQIIGQAQGPAPTMSLPDVVHRFKTLTTKRYTEGVYDNGWIRFDKKLWQRNYYEHIIRNEESYYQILQYIRTNPLKWQEDKYYNQNF